jgi:hypothetical protein
MPEETQENGSAKTRRSEPYTYDEFTAAVHAVFDRADPLLAAAEGYAQDEWFEADDRDAVNAHLLGNSGLLAGIAIGLQMAEARRDG